MKRIDRRTLKGWQSLSAKDRFAMEKEWAEFLLRKQMTTWLLALFGIGAMLGLIVGVRVVFLGLGEGSACVAMATIVVCIARVLNTLLRSLNEPKAH